MKIAVSEPNPCKRILDVELPPENVKEEFEKKISHYQQNAQVRGFRPGKVPRDIILTRFNDIIMGETVEEIINRSYEEACKQEKLVPVSRAKIDSVEYGESKPLKFKAEFEIDPAVELEKYTGLGIKVEKPEVTEKEVENASEELRERLASFKKVDRPSKKGDYMRYEYAKVIVDGKERTDYKNPTYPVEIGEAKIKEFNKALVGVTAGENVEVHFTFPKDYEVEEVREKPADFTLKIIEVQEKSLPELNDEFAKKVGPYENLEQMKTRIRQDLEAYKKEMTRRKATDDVVGKIIENNKILVPQSRIDSYAENMFEEMKKKYKNIGHEDSLIRYKEIGEKEIKKYKIVDFVAKKENIKATPEEVDAKIKEHAEKQGEKFEELKERFRRDGTTLMIRSDLREEKTVDWLIEHNQ